MASSAHKWAWSYLELAFSSLPVMLLEVYRCKMGSENGNNSSARSCIMHATLSQCCSLMTLALTLC